MQEVRVIICKTGERFFGGRKGFGDDDLDDLIDQWAFQGSNPRLGGGWSPPRSPTEEDGGTKGVTLGVIYSVRKSSHSSLCGRGRMKYER